MQKRILLSLLALALFVAACSPVHKGSKGGGVSKDNTPPPPPLPAPTTKAMPGTDIQKLLVGDWSLETMMLDNNPTAKQGEALAASLSFSRDLMILHGSKGNEATRYDLRGHTIIDPTKPTGRAITVERVTRQELIISFIGEKGNFIQMVYKRK